MTGFGVLNLFLLTTGSAHSARSSGAVGQRVRTLFAALVDFSRPGGIEVFVDAATIDTLDQVAPALDRALASGIPYCLNVNIRGTRSPFAQWQLAGKK